MRVGVAIVVGNAFGELLYLHRIDGCWGPPGGKMEDGELWAKAAARELLEETGLRCKRFQQLGWVDYVSAKQGQYITLFVKALSCRGIPINREPARHTEMRWALRPPKPAFAPLVLFLKTERRKVGRV